MMANHCNDDRSSGINPEFERWLRTTFPHARPTHDFAKALRLQLLASGMMREGVPARRQRGRWPRLKVAAVLMVGLAVSLGVTNLGSRGRRLQLFHVDEQGRVVFQDESEPSTYVGLDQHTLEILREKSYGQERELFRVLGLEIDGSCCFLSTYRCQADGVSQSLCGLSLYPPAPLTAEHADFLQRRQSDLTLDLLKKHSAYLGEENRVIDGCMVRFEKWVVADSLYGGVLYLVSKPLSASFGS